MRVAFLVAELGRSGGMGVIRDWARSLDDAVLVVCGPAEELPGEDDGVPVRPLAAMADEPVDVAIATWWTTCESLWDLPARRRAVLLQSLEQHYYRDGEPADRLGAAAVLDLPVAWLPIAPHLAAHVERVAPGARVHPVALGIDKEVFVPVPPRSTAGPLRVLIEGQPSMWFKGVAEAVAAVRRMRERATVTVVAADPGAAGDLGADRVCGGLAPAAMAALYAEHDVLLKLSRLEGRPLPVLEALHVGRPCVITPLPGLADVIEHGGNGLVVGVDDEPGTTAALDRLARDGDLRLRLSAGALATAAGLPSRAAAARAFEAALEAILAEEPAAIEPALSRLAHGARRAVEVARIEEWRRRGAEGGAAWWEDAWRQADAKNAEYDRWSRELRARIDELQRRPAFRVEERLRRLLGRGR
jgi:glycosyltransferase involved in cell wall biosynthesis